MRTAFGGGGAAVVGGGGGAAEPGGHGGHLGRFLRSRWFGWIAIQYYLGRALWNGTWC